MRTLLMRHFYNSVVSILKALPFSNNKTNSLKKSIINMHIQIHIYMCGTKKQVIK